MQKGTCGQGTLAAEAVPNDSRRHAGDKEAAMTTSRVHWWHIIMPLVTLFRASLHRVGSSF